MCSGVGPYVFGLGTLTFLLSKEIWVIEHGFMEFITFWAMFTILTKKLGTGMAKYFDSQTVVSESYWQVNITQVMLSVLQVIAQS